MVVLFSASFKQIAGWVVGVGRHSIHLIGARQQLAKLIVGIAYGPLRISLGQTIAVAIIGERAGVIQRVGLGGDVRLIIVSPGLHLGTAAATAEAFNPSYHIPAFALVDRVFCNMSQCVRHIGLRVANVIECVALDTALLFRCQCAALRIVCVRLENIA